MRSDGLVSLNFADNRVYDPALMRWLQTDPIGLIAGNNVYQFVGNGPTGAVDPLGLYVWNPFSKNASWSFEGSLLYDVIDKTLEPVRMGGDLLRAGQAGINNAVGGTPHVPEWRSGLARNAPPPADIEANNKYLMDAELENLEEGFIAAATFGAMKGGGKLVRKVVGRGATAAEGAAAKGANCPATKAAPPGKGVRGDIMRMAPSDAARSTVEAAAREEARLLQKVLADRLVELGIAKQGGLVGKGVKALPPPADPGIPIPQGIRDPIVQELLTRLRAVRQRIANLRRNPPPAPREMLEP
jgi:RHS repeat-associated protein